MKCPDCGAEAIGELAATHRRYVCPQCGWRSNSVRGGMRIKSKAERRRQARDRERRAKCPHRRYSAPVIETINGERREFARCLNCGEVRQPEAERG